MGEKSLTQVCWEWIEDQPDFHSTELARYVGQPMPKIKSVMDELIRRGCVEAVNKAAKPYVYRAVPTATPSFSRKRPNPHPQACKRQRIWQAMRYLGPKFTVEEVQAAADVKRGDATRFISDLRKYGYVALTRGQWGAKKQSAPRPCIYHLVENTGRKYPVVGKRGLRDQNTGKAIAPPKKEGN
ncbi:helix-turn-helix domain-containing protein [Alteromonas confluentis]|uniref:Transcription regulator TrmB N-terminal domain-containing protein n=1 Tax=Alteromonas confluentis TaxID=1656094 RepID=A0A1E7ZEA5_9ALTE|nr:helix-turn-helix domain-containing protein [Alteromonas confluentis]OFC71782.1 hypothetical protein BFC18_06410 [Alteromonas confluentis]